MSSRSSISSFDDLQLQSPSSESNPLRSLVTSTAPKSVPDDYDHPAPLLVATTPRTSSSISSSPPVALKTHREFYICDSLAEIEVEGYIFRVHRFFLDRESGQKFPKDTVGGPIVLSDVTCLEFESLMKFFYHGMHSTTIMSLTEWIAILSIATRYEMTIVRTRAISEVYALHASIDPVEWILIAEKNDVPEWLLDARTALCQRKTSLTTQESERLGHANSAMIAEAREAIRQAEIDSLRKQPCHSCHCTPATGSNDSEAERLIVDEVFGREVVQKKGPTKLASPINGNQSCTLVTTIATPPSFPIPSSAMTTVEDVSSCLPQTESSVGSHTVDVSELTTPESAHFDGSQVPPVYRGLVETLQQHGRMPRRDVASGLNKIITKDPVTFNSQGIKKPNKLIRLAAAEGVVILSETGVGNQLVQWISLAPAWRAILNSTPTCV